MPLASIFDFDERRVLNYSEDGLAHYKASHRALPRDALTPKTFANLAVGTSAALVVNGVHVELPFRYKNSRGKLSSRWCTSLVTVLARESVDVLCVTGGFVEDTHGAGIAALRRRLSEPSRRILPGPRNAGMIGCALELAEQRVGSSLQHLAVSIPPLRSCASAQKSAHELS